MGKKTIEIRGILFADTPNNQSGQAIKKKYHLSSNIDFQLSKQDETPHLSINNTVAVYLNNLISTKTWSFSLASSNPQRLVIRETGRQIQSPIIPLISNTHWVKVQYRHRINKLAESTVPSGVYYHKGITRD
jgi:hypothetical protein